MIEIYKNIYVGNEEDYYSIANNNGWAIVHACKDPFHREALGYVGRGAPKNHAEYFIAIRGNRIIMNIVDVDDPRFFEKERMIDIALDFAKEKYINYHVLFHCNQGESRGPSIALLFLATRLDTISNASYFSAETEFLKLYPNFKPKPGIRHHLINKWNEYCSK